MSGNSDGTGIPTMKAKKMRKNIVKLYWDARVMMRQLLHHLWHRNNNFSITLLCYSMMNQQTYKQSTIYYITFVTMPLHVSTSLRHPQGVRVKLHKHPNAELVIFLKLYIRFVVQK
jgi:hypothetical protein